MSEEEQREISKAAGFDKQEIEERKRRLTELLKNEGKNYHIDTPEYVRRGGARDIFRVEWGPCRIKRVAKIDRPFETIQTPGGRRTVIERGCDTSHELELISGIEHPGITKLVDYFKPEVTEKYGLPGTITVYDEFQDSKTLEELVSEESISTKILSEIFIQSAATIRDVSSGIGVAEKVGVFHRDLKPANYLIQIKDGKVVVKITDWANACRVDRTTEKYLPTAGGHLVTDPLLMGPFFDPAEQGFKTSYNFQSEIYCETASMLYAARRKPAFNCNPDTRTATVWDTGENLQDSEGKIDINKYEKALRRTIRNLPRAIRKKFRKIFIKGLTLDRTQRYSSVQEFYNDVEEAVGKPGLMSRTKKLGLAALVAATSIAVAGLGTGIYLGNKNQSRLEQTIKEQTTEREIDKHASIIERYLDGGTSRMDSSEYIDLKHLYAWMEKFCGNDFYIKEKRNKEKMYTAFAAYLESVWNYDTNEPTPPIKVYTAIQMAGGETDYSKIKPYLDQLDSRITGRITGIDFKYVDSYARTGNYEHEGMKKSWIKAKELYDSGEAIKKIEKERAEFEKRTRLEMEKRSKK